MQKFILTCLILFLIYVGFNQDKFGIQNKEITSQNNAETSVDVLPEHPYEKLLASTNSPIIMFFHAPSCSQCQTMYPIIENLKNQYGSYFHFESINMEDNDQHITYYLQDFKLNGKSSRISMACIKNPFCNHTIDLGVLGTAPSVFYINPKTRKRILIDSSNYFDQNLLTKEFNDLRQSHQSGQI